MAAEAALAIQDTTSAARALQELLFLQPPAAPGLPRAVANARRLQAFKLEEIESGKLQGSPGASTNPLALFLMLGASGLGGPVNVAPNVADQQESEDPLQAQMESIFASEYAILDEE